MAQIDDQVQALIASLFSGGPAAVPGPRGVPGPAFEAPLPPEMQAQRRLFELLGTPADVTELEPPDPVTGRDRVMAALAGFLGGAVGQPGTAASVLQGRERERRETIQTNQVRKEQAAREARGRVASAGAGLLESRRREGRQDRLAREAEERQANLLQDQSAEELTAMITSVEGLDPADFDLTTPTGRGLARGAVMRRQAQIERQERKGELDQRMSRALNERVDEQSEAALLEIADLASRAEQARAAGDVAALREIKAEAERTLREARILLRRGTQGQLKDIEAAFVEELSGMFAGLDELAPAPDSGQGLVNERGRPVLPVFRDLDQILNISGPRKRFGVLGQRPGGSTLP